MNSQENLKPLQSGGSELNDGLDPSTREQMTKKTALVLLQQAIHRISDEPINNGGRGWQCGGAYWRLAQVVELYLYPQLDAQEGKEHAKFLIETHGRITRGPNATVRGGALDDEVIDRIYHQGIEKYNEITDRLSKKWDEIGRPTNIDDYIPSGVEISLEEAAYHLRNGYIDAADSALKRCDA